MDFSVPVLTFILYYINPLFPLRVLFFFSSYPLRFVRSNQKVFLYYVYLYNMVVLLVPTTIELSYFHNVSDIQNLLTLGLFEPVH